MILQRLAEHYDRIEKELPRTGFSLQKISFCVVLEPDGRLNLFKDLRDQAGKALIAKSMIVPGQGKPSGQGLNPCFLWDNAAYMLGYKIKDLNPDRTNKEFQAYREAHLALQARVAHPAFDAVCLFLRDWSPEKALDHAAELSEFASNFGVFRIAGQMQYIHDLIHVPAETEEQLAASEASETRGVCLVSGATDEIARLHEPKIKGVAGAQSSGALLVSFNASAYESYGKSQSYNAPVGATIAFKYTNALNYLLNTRDRRVSLGDTTVVFWADHPNDPLEDCLSEMFADPLPNEDAVAEEDQERLRQAKLLLTQMRDGTGAIEVESDGQHTKFFLLGLSPNASRLSVRLWVEADAVEIRKLLGQHLRHCACRHKRRPPADPPPHRCRDRARGTRL